MRLRRGGEGVVVGGRVEGVLFAAERGGCAVCEARWVRGGCVVGGLDGA